MLLEFIAKLLTLLLAPFQSLNKNGLKLYAQHPSRFSCLLGGSSVCELLIWSLTDDWAIELLV